MLAFSPIGKAEMKNKTTTTRESNQRVLVYQERYYNGKTRTRHTTKFWIKGHQIKGSGFYYIPVLVLRD